MIYFPTNWGAKEPQNLPNHRVDVTHGNLLFMGSEELVLGKIHVDLLIVGLSCHMNFSFHIFGIRIWWQRTTLITTCEPEGRWNSPLHVSPLQGRE